MIRLNLTDNQKLVVGSYRNHKIEPNSYKLDEFGIPEQPSILTDSKYTKADEITSNLLENLMIELCEVLPSDVLDNIDDFGSGNDDYVFDDERLSFIQVPEGVTNASLIVSGYRTYLAQMIYCLENGITLDEYRVLHSPRSNIEFAIDLQYLRDNGIDIDKLDKSSLNIGVNIQGVNISLNVKIEE